MEKENSGYLPPVLSLFWIRVLAGTSCLIGLAGLIAMMSHSTWAAGEDQRKGFESGRPFSNAFAPPAGAPAAAANKPGTFFQDDEEDDNDDNDIPPANQANQNTNSPFGNSSARSQNSGITLGGGKPGGLISSPDGPKPLKQDNEGAEGSKEIITDFNFPDADIMDIAKSLGKLTGKNFLLDKDVKGRITIISNAPVTVNDAWKAFLTALDMNGFALIPSGNFIRIARQRDARDKQLKTYTGDYSPDTDALITRLFPLKYLSAEEVARNFRSFMPANSRIIPYEQTNTVIVTDTGANIAKLSKLLDILDVEGYEAGIEVIPVKYASAVELSKLIDTLIPGTSPTASGGAPRFPGGSGGKFAARRTKEGGIINTIIADERTNNLIVHANTKGADQVRELVSKLDKKMPSATGGGKVHVVYLQFAEAEQIGNTLNNLSQSPTTRPSGPGGGTGTNPVQASLFEGAIKVSPDKATNSLVITASPSDFVTIERVINKLDIPRDQVYAEVVIMEITLGKTFTFSTNVINPKNGIGFLPNNDLVNFLSNPLAGKGAIIGFKSGGAQNITVGTQTLSVSGVQGLIQALQVNSNANVLATPQILTLDNQEATFETAEKIPVPTSTTSNGVVSNSITKESVSLSITIKPQINKLSNFVKLDISTKLADISNRELPAQVAGLALATTERTAKTSIVVADEDTVVLGGLMRDNLQDTISKIPILGDIPLLGWLFRARNTTTAKTNMLIFITPKIIRQYENVRMVLDKKLKERDDFLESNAGGEDPNRPYRDKMIRDLPDLKKITSAKPQNIHTIESGQENPEDSQSSFDQEQEKLERPAAIVAPKTHTMAPPPSTMSPAPPSTEEMAPPTAPAGGAQ